MTTCVCDRVSPSGSRSRYYGGEQETLEAMEKFRKFYEEKMKEIDTDGGGDCLQLKLKLQEKWIGDLTEQTEMMARIVKELEEEATARVQMLEERLRQTSKTAYEKVFYLENDLKNLLEFIRRKRDDDNWSIEGLQFYDVTYDDLFGSSKDDTALIPISNGSSSERKKESSPKMEKWTHPEFEEMLRKKDEDYQALKQSMLDMRSALTEEVACKHDMISALKKDVQQLEERCVQADKQTAFKDDIIKELRKEIKQLKQQLRKERSEEMEELERKLQDAENLIRSMRPCVETKTAHTTIDDDVRFKSKDKKLEDEICRRQCEVDKLKCRCQELEKALENSQARADNLQKAESTKIEVKKLRHQKRCYQHALECLKNEMGVMSEQLISLQEILNLSKQSCIEDKGQLHNAIVNLQTVCDRLHQKLIEAEKKSVIETQMNQLKDQKIDELQVIIGQKNADLNVHDAAIHEMKLKLENAIIENHELQNTITSLNSTMMQLRCDNSKAMSKRNTISFRDDDEKMAVRYDKLKMDYKSQTEMLKSLQKEFERAKEKDKEKTRSLKRQMEALQDKLAKSEMYNHKLISELENLKEQATEMCDKDYCREQQLAQSKNIILELRQTMIELNESLINSEFHHTTLAEAFEIKIKDDRQNEDIYLSCKCEIALYKRLVEDLKGTLGNLKKKFADVEEQNRNLHDELKYRETKLNELQTRLARTEHQTCQNVAELMDKLKRSQAEEKRLCEFIEQLKKEVHKKIVQSHDKRAAPREIDVGSCACGNDNKMTIVGRCACGNENKMAGAGGCACGYENKMAGAGGCACGYENKMAGAGGCACDYEDKMTSAGAPEDSETNIVGCVCCACANENKNPELSCVCNDFNNSDTKIGGCVCNEPNNEMDELETSYEEIKMLKTQIKKLLQSQFSLNNEVTCLQTTLTALEEKNRHLKQKLEKSQCDNQKIREQMKILQREKENLAQTVTNLEVELADVRNNRDDVCAESKHVVSNVKAWLEEQKKINDKVKKKAQCYCDTITKLKQENANLMNQPSPKNYNKLNSMKCYNPHTQSPPPACYTPQSCEYPWCLGSQGMDSPRDSPSSFQTCSVEEWYSPNFRDETDLETDPEEEFLHRLQAATLEMKNNNRKLTNKYKKECDCSVTKDKK